MNINLLVHLERVRRHSLQMSARGDRHHLAMTFSALDALDALDLIEKARPEVERIKDDE